VTTNDNARRSGSIVARLRVAEIRRGAVDEIRRTIKPSIPLVGHGGVEMHDEIELRRPLAGGRSTYTSRPMLAFPFPVRRFERP
jgi:hypothetical protein